MKTRIIFLLIIITLSSCGIRNFFTFYPDKKTEIANTDIPSYAKEIFIKTSDGKKIQTFYFSHNDTGKHKLIIYFHGNAGNLYHRFDYAKKLYSMNANVLLVSYRGYAKSTGKPNEKGIYIDGYSAIKYANDTLNYPDKNIIIFGRSLGTTVAIHTSQNRKFNGVILVTPLSSGKEMATAFGMNSFKFVAGDSYNSIEKINNLKSRIIIIGGDKDKTTPYFMSVNLYKKYTGIKKLVTIKNGGHNSLHKDDSKLFWNSIEEFINN